MQTPSNKALPAHLLSFTSLSKLSLSTGSAKDYDANVNVNAEELEVKLEAGNLSFFYFFLSRLFAFSTSCLI